MTNVAMSAIPVIAALKILIVEIDPTQNSFVPSFHIRPAQLEA